jgi:hypothetical protein
MNSDLAQHPTSTIQNLFVIASEAKQRRKIIKIIDCAGDGQQGNSRECSGYRLIKS